MHTALAGMFRRTEWGIFSLITFASYVALRRDFVSQRPSYGTPHTLAIAVCTGRDSALRRMTIDMSSGVTPRYSAKETSVGKPLMLSKSLMYWVLFSFFSLSSLALLSIIVLILKLQKFSVKKKVPDRELFGEARLTVCRNMWKPLQVGRFIAFIKGSEPGLVFVYEF